MLRKRPRYLPVTVSNRGGMRAETMQTPIAAAKPHDTDTQPWLAEILGRIVETTLTRLDERFP